MLTFFITETYLTFVINFIHLTNFWFDPVDTSGVPVGPWGSGDDPKVIYLMTEGSATTFVDWAKLIFCVSTNGWTDSLAC